MVVGSIPKLIMCVKIYVMRKDEGGRRVKERRHVRNLSLIIKKKKGEKRIRRRSTVTCTVTLMPHLHHRHRRHICLSLPRKHVASDKHVARVSQWTDDATAQYAWANTGTDVSGNTFQPAGVYDAQRWNTTTPAHR